MIPALVEEARRVAAELRKAEDAIAAAVVAAVSAEVPGPWIGAQREASIEADGATVGVAWSEEGWIAYATGPRVVGEYVEGLPASSPSLALAALERRLHRGSKPWRVAACSLVVRLRRGWL